MAEVIRWYVLGKDIHRNTNVLIFRMRQLKGDTKMFRTRVTAPASCVSAWNVMEIYSQPFIMLVYVPCMCLARFSGGR